MSVSDELADYVHDQLAPLGHIERRRMFGGVGFRLNGAMIAILSRNGGLYLKSAAGAGLGEALQSRRADKKSGEVRVIPLPYYRLPEGVLDDAERLQALVLTHKASIVE